MLFILILVAGLLLNPNYPGSVMVYFAIQISTYSYRWDGIGIDVGGSIGLG